MEREEESEGGESTSRRTLPEPEPHDVGQTIRLSEALAEGLQSHSAMEELIDFSEVLSFFSSASTTRMDSSAW